MGLIFIKFEFMQVLFQGLKQYSHYFVYFHLSVLLLLCWFIPQNIHHDFLLLQVPLSVVLGEDMSFTLLKCVSHFRSCSRWFREGSVQSSQHIRKGGVLLGQQRKKDRFISFSWDLKLKRIVLGATRITAYILTIKPDEAMRDEAKSSTEDAI